MNKNDDIFYIIYLFRNKHFSPQESVLSLQQHAHISDHDAKVFCEKLLNNIDDLERLHQLILWHPMTIPDSGFLIIL
jgi:hypothetical protein